MTTDHNTIHWVFAIIAFVILVAFLIGLLIGGLMHAAKRADNLGLIEPEDLMTDSERRALAEKRDGMKGKIANKISAGDGVSNAGYANCEIQAGTGEPPIATMREHPVVGSATVVNAPLSQSSPSVSSSNFPASVGSLQVNPPQKAPLTPRAKPNEISGNEHGRLTCGGASLPEGGK